MASVLLMTTSCIKDEKIQSNNYCYISSVKLGTLKRAVHTKNSQGKDSVYYSSYSGAQITMSIDQRNQVIENRDSLLYGTSLRAVLVTITYDGSVLAYRTAGSDEEWTSYKSSDSINLSKPIELITLANDGNSSRVYTLKVNVHQQEGDSLYWSQAEKDVPELTGMNATQAVVLDGKLTVLCSNTAGVQLATRSGLSSTGTWQLLSTDLPATADVHTLMMNKFNQTLYVSTTDGLIYNSVNGTEWNPVGTAQPGLRLVGINENAYYALIGGELYRSTDATNWNEKERLDTDPAYLPAKDVKSLQFQQKNGNWRMLLMGYRDNATDTTAVVWNKMWNHSYPENEAEWVYFNQTKENPYACPHLTNLNLLAYDGRCMAFGGASADGKIQAMEELYFSNDYGITWRPDLQIRLPEELKGVEGPIASVVDGSNVIWIIANNQIWFGRLNRLGFLRQ